ncbi:oxygen-independent coproporphyrinogen-3 oxidase [Flavobacterium fontis]|uniref:Heme chaperone HemW n=1 Tax=Flavobacterium fontis TaxID=1124188 RepID=A0A1M4WWM2_9FLAO|nr:radical SAM family heme chaperone HemW [Flavobacterium fontis]SHE85629.1 oxygen-independent coproporphyrinogen-3 oxidase [Flavobacterium fontis]
MSGIYLHIPFCKQACHYCDFHFSTSLKKKEALVAMMAREMVLRNHWMGDQTVIETIYFGGGTPSLLTIPELLFLIETIYQHFEVVDQPEITLEANPDDLTPDYLHALAQTPVNRLSIGVQSFFEEDLQLMNRAHNAQEALACLQLATTLFDNITLDLIYGIPGLTHEKWLANIQTALDLGVPHISSYALTVEPKTALHSFVQKGIIPNPDDGQAQEQFLLLMDQLEAAGFVHYELSNFGKEGFFSKNNSAYWLGKPYIGIGPAAHSFNGTQRGWNISNNTKYIQALEAHELPIELETLSLTDRYNEYVMTGLRTIWGVDLHRLETEFGPRFKTYFLQQAEAHLEDHLLFIDGDIVRTTRKGKFLSDGIASDLFLLNL